jgi:hypothetical protein
MSLGELLITLFTFSTGLESCPLPEGVFRRQGCLVVRRIYEGE